MKMKNHHILCTKTPTICIDGQCYKNYLLMIFRGLEKDLNLQEISYKKIMKIAI